MGNWLKAALAAGAICSAGAANAATVDISAYDTTTVVLDEAAGFVEAIGFFDFFGAGTNDLALFVEAFAPTDPLNASLDFSGLPAILIGASEAFFGVDIVEFLFEDAGTGYLVTISTGSQGIDFGDPNVDAFTDASLSLDELTVASPIPLPAGGILILTALGGLGALRGRRKAA